MGGLLSGENLISGKFVRGEILLSNIQYLIVC